MKNLTLYVCGLVISSLLVACGGGGGQGAVAGGGGEPRGGDVPGGGGGGVPLGPRWQVAQALETAHGRAEKADVAINAEGVAYAVWTRVGGNRTSVMSSRYVNGQWDVAKEVSTAVPVNHVAENPQVVVHKNGRATAIWAQSNQVDKTFLMGATTDAEGNWRSLPAIATLHILSTHRLNLVSDGQNTARAIWSSRFAVSESQFDGTQFQAARKISGAGNDRAFAGVMSAHGSDLLAVWIEGDPNNSDKNTVFVRSFVNGVWSADALALSSPSSGNVFLPHVALAANGKAVAIWEELDGDNTKVVARIATDSTGLRWDAEKRLASGRAFNLEPVVSIDPQGKAVVAWIQGAFPNNGKVDVAAAHFDGLDWKTSNIVEAMNLGAWVRVGMNNAGGAHAVWVQADPDLKMKASRMDATTGKWETPETIDKDILGGALFPVLAVNAKGQSVAAWEAGDGFLNSIAANILK